MKLTFPSWVVVDPTINQDMMEMYADVESRAGVLEPAGMVGIKYRENKLLETMNRLDDQCKQLKSKIDVTANEDEKAKLSKELRTRQEKLLPVYQQISVQFADLHDRSGRMLAKGVIRKELEWCEARRYFFWRVRRRLNEEYLLKRIGEQIPHSTRLEKTARLSSFYSPSLDVANDKEVALWIEDNHKILDSQLKKLKGDAVKQTLAKLFKSDIKNTSQGLAEIMSLLPMEEKNEILKLLK